MKKSKGLERKLLRSEHYQKILSRDEKKQIMGGWMLGGGGCQITEQATTNRGCSCGIDKVNDGKNGGVCCISC